MQTVHIETFGSVKRKHFFNSAYTPSWHPGADLGIDRRARTNIVFDCSLLLHCMTTANISGSSDLFWSLSASIPSWHLLLYITTVCGRHEDKIHLPLSA